MLIVKTIILKDTNFKLNSHMCGEMGIFFFLLNIRFISSIYYTSGPILLPIYYTNNSIQPQIYMNNLRELSSHLLNGSVIRNFSYDYSSQIKKFDWSHNDLNQDSLNGRVNSNNIFIQPFVPRIHLFQKQQF